MGSALAAWRGSYPALFLWCVWVLGAVVGVAVVAGVATLADLGWGTLDYIGLAPGRQIEELGLNGLLGLGLSLPQYVIFRRALGNRSPAAVAWVPTAVILFVLQDVVSLLWLRGAPHDVATVAGIVFGVLLAVVQALLLAEIVGTRSAAVLWVLGMVVFAALSYVLPVDAFYRALLAVNVVTAVLVEVAVFGAIYGSITGAAFVTSVKISSRAPAPAAR